MISLWKGKNPIYCGVIRSKVKVTITIRVLPLPQGNHVVKFGKDPIYKTKSYHAETILLSKILFIVTVTLTFDPEINRVLPLPQGNHVAKFDKDPIYRTKSYHAEMILLSKILFIVMVTLTFDLMTPQ
jgi:hypothetical protein